MAKLALYDRWDRPHSKEVPDTLDEFGLDYDETVVPNEHAGRTELYERTGQRDVPALSDPTSTVDG